MIELCKCILEIVFFLFVYFILGMNIHKDRNASISMNILTGFFVYFSIFQFLALPLILCKAPLHILTGLWAGILCIIVILSVRRVNLRAYLKWLRTNIAVPLLPAAVCAVILTILLYYALRYGYNGFDTAYYIGTVNTSVYRDSMYLYDGLTGTPVTFLELRYALSSFYMNSAVVCQLTGLPALLQMRIVTGGMCILLSHFCVYELGSFLFKGDKAKTLYMTALWGALNLLWRSDYTPSQFLLLRSYEAKSYCANVLLLFLVLLFFRLWNHVEDKTLWGCLAILCLSCDAISMSCIVIMPAAVSLYFLALLIGRKMEVKSLIGYYAACIFPCLVYVGMYFLYLKGIFYVGV